MSVFSDLILGDTRESYDIQHVTVSKSLTSTGSTDIVNVTETGRLISIAMTVAQALSGTTPVVTLDITVDGGTTRSIKMYTSALVWNADGLRPWSRNAETLDGQSLIDNFVIPFGSIRYKTSLQISINVTTAVGTNGFVRMNVIRGKKL